MTGDVKAAIAALEQGMKIEREGREFYLKAAKTTQDEKGRDIFTTLASDEEKHYSLMERERDSLSSEGRWVEAPEVKAVARNLNEPLFPRGKEAFNKAVSSGSGDWDALLFGLDIEIRSYNYYRKAASETDDVLGKQAFEFLAGEERGHYDTLMMRYDFLFGPVAWQS